MQSSRAQWETLWWRNLSRSSFCQQKPNLSHETVPLNSYFFLWPRFCVIINFLGKWYKVTNLGSYTRHRTINLRPRKYVVCFYRWRTWKTLNFLRYCFCTHFGGHGILSNYKRQRLLVRYISTVQYTCILVVQYYIS